MKKLYLLLGVLFFIPLVSAFYYCDGSWCYSDANGNPLKDESGNNRTLTNSGAIYNTSGWYEFNKGGNRLIMSSTLNGSSLCFKAKVKDNNTQKDVFTSGSQVMGVRTAGYWSIYNGTAWTVTTAGIKLNNTWQSVCYVFNNSGYNLYYDGNFNIFISASYFNINTISQSSVGNSFNGSIDDVRIYNRSLSASEVLALYNNQSISDEGLVAWYLFTNGTPSTLSGGSTYLQCNTIGCYSP